MAIGSNNGTSQTASECLGIGKTIMQYASVRGAFGDIYIYIHSIYVCVFIYMYVCVCIYVCIYMYMCIYICMYVYIYIRMYVYIYIYMRVCVCLLYG